MNAADVKILLLDVDGVMTDGSIMLDDHGVETKRFHVRDGTGIRVWLKLGYDIALITGRRGNVVHHRAKELGIMHVVQGSTNKLTDVKKLLQSLNLKLEDAAMLGDDLPDLALMQVVGYPMAVADAVTEIREVARLVTERAGGHAAVREAIEHLLRAKGCWEQSRKMFG